ncbi:DEAD/DEAH box helicase [bacterium]|jgi:superfamily II DNA or RNA helicase|nr:DEAD/DEAH box helicase [bacterium]
MAAVIPILWSPMPEIILEIREKVSLNLNPLDDFLGTQRYSEFLKWIESSLSIPNPTYQQAIRFARRRRFLRVPKTLNYFKIRKPKTDPKLEVPIGFLEPLATKLRELTVPVKVEIGLTSYPAEIESTINLYDYQKAAVENCLKRHRGILVAPCGSGKTVMGLQLLAQRRERALVLVHTLDLLSQWSSQIKENLGIQAGLIGAGKEETEAEVIVATVQTMIRRQKSLMRLSDQVGTLIVDECHHVPATTFQKVVASFRPTNLYGLSATPEREDGLTRAMHLFLGPQLHRITHEDLQKENRLLRPRLQTIETQFFFPYDSEEPESYNKMIEKLTTDLARNTLICEWLVRYGHQKNLVLSQRVSHCQLLVSKVRTLLPEANCEVLTGSTERKERHRILESAKEGRVDFIFATQLADEGLDIQCLENLWLVTPGRNVGRIEQRIGRIMREFEAKIQPMVFDFVDSKTRVLFSQYRTRLNKVYRRLLEL